jgi:hypothetical protein
LKLQFGLIVLLLFAACRPSTASVDTLPTSAQLPTMVATIPTATEERRAGPPTLPPTFTPEPTQTSAATHTHIPTITVTLTPSPTLAPTSNSPISDSIGGTGFPTSTVGEFWLGGGGDFSQIGTAHADGYYLATAVGFEGVSEILWSKAMRINNERAYHVYFRLRFPSDLTPGTYSLKSEQDFDSAETVTAIFWYYDGCCGGDVVLDENPSGTITFTEIGTEVSARFEYTASSGDDTVNLEGVVENVRSD